MRKLKMAVLGLGRIGWGFHLPEIVKHGDRYELVGVADVSEERLAEAKATYGVAGYTDIAELIAAQHPDVVVICSPTHLHKEHACTAMRLGCDVFLDKPMAVDFASAQQIADCAKETGRKLMVYQPHRATAMTNQLKAIIASGKIGKPYYMYRSSTSFIRRNDWQSLTKFGGGMLNNYGAHYIDGLLFLAESKVRRLSCITRKIASVGDADDVVKATFETQDNTILDLDISQAAALPMPLWIIYGEYGAVICKSAKGPFNVRYYDPAAVPEAVTSESLAAANRSYNNDIPLPFVEEEIPLDPGYAVDFYEKAYAYYALDQAPYVPVEETLYVMEQIEACHKDAQRE